MQSIQDLNLRSYSSNDQEDLWKLYNTSELGKLWPIKENRLLDVLLGKSDVNNKIQIKIMELNKTVIAFICIKNKIVGNENRGVIALVLVDKKYRKRGIGTLLINSAKDWFRETGVTVIKLGGGAGSWLWSGVPKNLNCVDFFKKNSFVIKDELSSDMFQNIEKYAPPKKVYDCLVKENVTITQADPSDKEQILEVEKKYFLDWVDFYKQDLENSKHKEILLAKHEDKIIGITGIWVGNCNWDLLFENNVGGGKALGIIPEWRGKGIGLALKSYGTEILRDNHVKYCWIGWTYAEDFYKKLGYEVWQRYYTGEIRLR
ncbi:MAG: acetyltransferase [uncultured bacterium]|nr:MAG: acetyltransferase [uncultured bacterium]